MGTPHPTGRRSWTPPPAPHGSARSSVAGRLRQCLADHRAANSVGRTERVRVPPRSRRGAGTASDGEKAHRDTVTSALRSLSSGRSVVIYAASGPDDPSIRATRHLMATALGLDSGNTARVLGAALGRIARELIALSGIGRVVIAGGDTSSYATQELGLYGLEMLGELAAGAPLCRGYRPALRRARDRAERRSDGRAGLLRSGTRLSATDGSGRDRFTGGRGDG